MALTDEQLEIISEALLPLFQYLEKEVIIDVANRIKKSLAYTRTAELKAESMQRMGYSPVQIRKEALKLLNADAEFQKMVARNTNEHKKTVKKLLKEIYEQALKEKDTVLAESANTAFQNDVDVWEQDGKELKDNSFLQQLVEGMKEQTATSFKNLTQTTGFKTVSGFEAVENLYRRELDKAMIKVCTGTYSHEEVVYDVVHSLADSGLRSIDYGSGRSMQLDTAVRLAVRTGAHQLAGKVTDENIKRTDVNLVRVSKHWGARNTGTGHANHEQWQGKVYFIKEGNDYSKEARRIGQDRITSLWYATGYSVDGAHVNDPLGLNGYNCRHRHYAWFEGISELPVDDPEPAPVTINGKTYDYYAITQKMRSMERGIRGLKREREALSALGDDTTEVKAKIRKKISEYHQFCKDAGVKAKDNRLRYEAGTSDLKKTKAWGDFEVSVMPENDAGKKREFADLSNKSGLNADMFQKRSGINDKVVLEYNKNSKAIQSTLRKVEKSKQNLDYEVGTIIDLKGNVVAEFSGGSGNVQVAVEMLKDAIFTHNHPIGGCFSAADISNMIEAGVYELRASTPQGIYYSLKRMPGVKINASIVSAYKQATSKKNAQDAIKRDVQSGILERDVVVNHKEEVMLEYRSCNGEEWLSQNANKCGLLYEKGVYDE